MNKGRAHEVSVLHKELQATKGFWEQERCSSPRSSTPIGYPIRNSRPWKHSHTIITLYILSRLYLGIYVYIHTQCVWQQLIEKEAMSLKETKAGSMGGFGWGKGRGEWCNNIRSSKRKKKKKGLTDKLNHLPEKGESSSSKMGKEHEEEIHRRGI